LADDRGQGITVVRVVEGTPAAEAKLSVNDRIVAIEGKAVSSLDDMAAILKSKPAGEKVRFDVERNGERKTIEVTLGRRPPPGQRPFDFGRVEPQATEPGDAVSPAAPPQAAPPPAASDPAAPPIMRALPRGQLLGIRTAPVNEDVRRRQGAPRLNGALVVSRVVGSPADRAGIPLDSIIVAVDGQPVASPTELARLITAAGPGKQVELTYYAAGEPHKVQVTLADAQPPADAGLPPGVGEPGLLPALPDADTTRQSAARRIEQLERRVEALEQRIADLERALKGAPAGRENPPVPAQPR
jgi:membrane-associated protease RseP (regulator of RpoE activity)